MKKLSNTEVKLKKDVTYPVYTRRKLDAHKMFRRRPERLLNVLCTFNLRPVSTRIKKVCM